MDYDPAAFIADAVATLVAVTVVGVGSWLAIAVIQMI
jgi:hypothetical protein